MKKHILKIAAVLILASAILPSCSVQYRERHHHHYDDHGYNHP